jgi:hypothetical protein
VLILPPGHAEQLRIRRRLSPRERWMVGGVLGAVVALAIALIVALALPGPKSSRGCIYLTIAGSVGAQYIYHCGAEAQGLCRTAARPGAVGGPALIAECRKAGLPVGG